MPHMTSNDIQDLPDDLRKAAEAQLGTSPAAKKRNKYGAKPVRIDGHYFASQAEARYYLRLLVSQRAKEITHFHRQVPFDLPGGTKYVVDFQVFHADGRVEYVDVKGKRTAMFIRNKKQVESLYPVKIKEVK